MNLLLDTHTFLWWIAGDRALSQRDSGGLSPCHQAFHRRTCLGEDEGLGQKRRASDGVLDLATARGAHHGNSGAQRTDAARKLAAIDVPNTMSRGSFTREAKTPARFKPGDRVRTKNIHPETHTRLPRYARNRVGVVEALRGCHVFPDTAALGKGDDPQWLYPVLFEGRELWGDSAEPSLKVSIEAFEPYLELV